MMPFTRALPGPGESRAPRRTARGPASRRPDPAQAEALAPVAVGLHGLAPAAMVEVRAHGPGQPGLEVVPGRPPKLAADLRGIDGVAAVVAGPIRDEDLEAGVAGGGPAGHGRVPGGGIGGLELEAEPVDDLHVGAL